MTKHADGKWGRKRKQSYDEKNIGRIVRAWCYRCKGEHRWTEPCL